MSKDKPSFWGGYWSEVANAQAKLNAYKDTLDAKTETDKLTLEGVVGIIILGAVIVIAGFLIWRVVH